MPKIVKYNQREEIVFGQAFSKVSENPLVGEEFKGSQLAKEMMKRVCLLRKSTKERPKISEFPLDTKIMSSKTTKFWENNGEYQTTESALS